MVMEMVMIQSVRVLADMGEADTGDMEREEIEVTSRQYLNFVRFVNEHYVLILKKCFTSFQSIVYAGYAGMFEWVKEKR